MTSATPPLHPESLEALVSLPLPRREGCRAVAVLLPLPPRAASPNARVSHWARHAAVSAYRRDCALLLSSAVRHRAEVRLLREAAQEGRALPLTIHLAWIAPPPRSPKMPRPYCPRDEDNARACAKAAQDALQDAGFFPEGDSRKYCRSGGIAFATDRSLGSVPGLLLVLEESPAPAGAGGTPAGAGSPGASLPLALPGAMASG